MNQGRWSQRRAGKGLIFGRVCNIQTFPDKYQASGEEISQGAGGVNSLRDDVDRGVIGDIIHYFTLMS